MISMKARKATIKKPGFLLPYFLSAFLLLILAAGAAVIICMPVYFEYEFSLQEEMDEKFESVRDFFKESLNKQELTPTDIATAKEVLISHYGETGQRCEVVISGNIESPVKLDSTRTAILVYAYEAEDGEYSWCYLRLADNKYLKYFDTDEAKSKAYVFGQGYNECFHNSYTVDFDCKRFYANFEKGLFIPVEAEILTWHSDPTGITVKINPENTEGFTLISKEDHDPCYAKASIKGYEPEGNEGPLDFTDDEFGNTYHSFGFKAGPMKEIHFYEKYKYKIDFAVVLICCGAFIFAFVPATIIYNTRKRRYEIFEYRRKMVDAMAHDLKTPMAAISAYAENLSNNIATDKKEYYAGKIEDKVAQMNRMVNDILEFSKSENSNSVITKENVDIADVIEKIISDNEHIISERSLKINFTKKSVSVRTDLNLFRMAIANLINNAVLYSKEGTEISITCDEKNLVIINIAEEVSDNAKDLKDPFVKGSKARSTGGTGLGLAIANNNLAMLGFKLDVKYEDDRFVATVKL